MQGGGEPHLGWFGLTHLPALQTRGPVPTLWQVPILPQEESGSFPGSCHLQLWGRPVAVRRDTPQSRKLGSAGRNSARIPADSRSARLPLANGNLVIHDREWQTPAPGNVAVMYVSVINQRICKRGIKYLIIIVLASLRGGGGGGGI